MQDKPATDRWLSHKREMTGPDGTAAVLARSLHPTQEPEKVLSVYQKSYGRGGQQQYAPIRVVQLAHDLVAQGRAEDVDTLRVWLRQQFARAKGEDPGDLMDLMEREQEADGADDPLQLRLAAGDWTVADETATRLFEQAARSERLALVIQQVKREREMA